MRVLNRLHSSGRWLRGSQPWLAERCEKMRSLARLFSSSRRAPPKATSNCHLSSACRRPSVFITWVCTAEPEAIGEMPRARPSSLIWTMHVDAEPRGRLVAKRDHLAEFPGGVDVQQRKGQLAPARTPSARRAASRAESLPIE